MVIKTEPVDVQLMPADPNKPVRFVVVDGRLVPEKIEARVVFWKRHYVIEVGLLLEDGRSVVDYLLVRRIEGCEPITAKMLAGIDVQTITEYVIGVASGIAHQTVGTTTDTVAVPVVAGRKKTVLTDDFLRAVAAVVRQAQANGERIDTAVAKSHLGPTSERNAQRWIQAAGKFLEGEQQ